MEPAQDGPDILQPTRFILPLERIFDLHGGTVVLLDVEFRDLDVLVRLDVFQVGILRVEIVVMRLDGIGVLVLGDDLGGSHQGSVRLHPHRHDLGDAGSRQVPQVHPFAGAVERDHTRLVHQEERIQDIQVTFVTRCIQEPGLAIRRGHAQDEGVERAERDVVVDQHAARAAPDHDRLGGVSQGIQRAGRQGVDVHVGTGAPPEDLPRQVGNEVALLVPFHLPDDMVPDGDDARLVTLHARKRGFQFLGVLETALAHVEDVRLLDGLVYVGPFHADALIDRPRNDQAGHVIGNRGAILVGTVGMGFVWQGGHVHGVEDIRVHLIGYRARQIGHALLLLISGRDGTALGAVDREILRVPHLDVRLVDGDRQLDVDVVDGEVAGGAELVGHLDDRADLHVLGGEGAAADVLGVDFVEVELLGHHRPDDLPVFAVVCLHLDA